MSYPPISTWGLDPLYGSYRKLLIHSIHKDIELITKPSYIEMYLYQRPIRKAEIVGIVVRKKISRRQVVIQIDDGSGILECYQYFEANSYTPLGNIELGLLVLMKGCLEVNLDSMMVLGIKSVHRVSDPNIETQHWVEAMYLKKTMYSLPFIYQGPKVPLTIENPFLTCTCNGLISNTMSSDAVCQALCQFITQDDINIVKQTFLYCRCHNQESNCDPTNFLRISILALLLRLSTNQLLLEDIKNHPDVIHMFKSYLRYVAIVQYIEENGPDRVPTTRQPINETKDEEVRHLVVSVLMALKDDGVIAIQRHTEVVLITATHTILKAVTQAVDEWRKDHLIQNDIQQGETSILQRAQASLPPAVPAWRVHECWNKYLLEQYSLIMLRTESTSFMNGSLAFFASSDSYENVKCFLIAQQNNIQLLLQTHHGNDIPMFPAIRDGECLIFGANQICWYLYMKSKPKELQSHQGKLPKSIQNLFNGENHIIGNLITNNATPSELTLAPLLQALESVLLDTTLSADIKSFASFVLSVSLDRFVSIVNGITSFPTSKETILSIINSPEYTHSKSAASASLPAAVEAPHVEVVEIREADGVMGMLRAIFTNAIRAAFPASVALSLDVAVMARCGNAGHGDYQCNNAMALTKALKSTPNYKGPSSPKQVAELIEKALIPHVLISSTSTAPNGFINIFISRESIVTNFKQLLLQGTKNVCRVEPRKVLVDFSSPNIAKEMHVGHLRSTIIGDAICRILEFCGHDVDRVNHVGDWGTQFGMLITYLQDAYPDILVNPPNISDLTLIYKASKKRFDDEPEFKERARTNVVNLQRGDVACRAIWILLCEISRKEFQKVYDILNVRVKEVGESFYNPMIPSMITELQQKGFIIEDEGMLIVRLAHFEIPLIARKSDGGYGYDSTDLTAIRYRLHDLHRDWIIYVTDEGQGNHFHMCFDVAKAVGWTTSSTDKTAVSSRLDHIGFGVVCGDDGKRLKTRSAEGNVRLIDLLDEARSRMFIALEERSKEGKNSLSKEDVENAAKVIGYGAVKYFDLKQHPSTNYIFNFDRMLDTKGDTAVYLLFAYARLTSILTKAEELKGISINALIEKTFSSSDFSNLDLQHPAEKSLIFELFQFGDMIRSVLNELLPNRVCDYLKEISVKFTDFITRCHVLNAKEDGPDAEMTMASRLLLCEATRRVMETCFNLLGIDTLTRI